MMQLQPVSYAGMQMCKQYYSCKEKAKECMHKCINDHHIMHEQIVSLLQTVLQQCCPAPAHLGGAVAVSSARVATSATGGVAAGHTVGGVGGRVVGGTIAVTGCCRAIAAAVIVAAVASGGRSVGSTVGGVGVRVVGRTVAISGG